MFSYPDHFVRIQTDLHGSDGLNWLNSLPTIVNDCADRWNLRLNRVLQPLTYNYLVSAHRYDGTPVIIKACSPTGEFQTQANALQHFAGRGCVQLLERDDNLEVQLMEACVPGSSLVGVPDDDAVTIAAGTMRQLWSPLPSNHRFPSLSDWGQGLDRLRAFYDGTGPFPQSLVERAERTFAEFSTSTEPRVLLHGDLHHDNILSAERQPWIAIDPKGVAGEPAYEMASFILNPHAELSAAAHLDRILARRVDRFAAELELDREKITEWAIAAAVLSAWWTVEDHGHVSELAMTCASLLAEIP
ncbi:MAG TPA: aminoglycoside phosphotransferase family protein [Nitrolancea sp.]|nr:aminoglycoside phosphotransferase family protein [Nitrolancea sp.]